MDRPACRCYPAAVSASVKPRAWLSWSSGKDSAWARHDVQLKGAVEVVGLLTTVSSDYARVSAHGVREAVLEAQAEAVGLPLRRVLIPSPCSDELYEERISEALREAKSAGVSEMLFGDVFLEDVRAYRERQLGGSGITPRFPLWGAPARRLAEQMIAAGLIAYVACVDMSVLPAELCGRRFDNALLDALPPGVDPCGERGEFHTIAAGGPMFRKPLRLLPGAVVQRDGFAFADFELMP